MGRWAGAGFTGRANSALPVGDPGLPLPEAVAAVEDWYRRRDLRPVIVLPQGAGPDPLPAYLAERSWLPRPGPAFVMTAEIADLPASTADVRFSPEPGSAFPLASGPPPTSPSPFMAPPSLVARSLVHRSSLLGPVGTAALWLAGRRLRRPGQPRLTTGPSRPTRLASRSRGSPSALAAAAARGARRILLQVETGNGPARALYQRCGFRDSHRYEYMLAP
jgi:hypothetical protein